MKILILLLLIPIQAMAIQGKDYPDSPYKLWAPKQMLTDRSQVRFAFHSCCDESEIVQTQFLQQKGDVNDVWFWLKDGQWREIPEDIIHWLEPTPDGRAVLFIWHDVPTCFYPPQGGY